MLKSYLILGWYLYLFLFPYVPQLTGKNEILSSDLASHGIQSQGKKKVFEESMQVFHITPPNTCLDQSIQTWNQKISWLLLVSEFSGSAHIQSSSTRWQAETSPYKCHNSLSAKLALTLLEDEFFLFLSSELWRKEVEFWVTWQTDIITFVSYWNSIFFFFLQG